MTTGINVKNLTVEKVVEEFGVLHHEHVEVTFTDGTIIVIEPDEDGDFTITRRFNGQELKDDEAYLIESEDLYKRLELAKQHYGVHNSKQANPELWEEKEGVLFYIKEEANGLVACEWIEGEYEEVVEEWYEEQDERIEDFEREQDIREYHGDGLRDDFDDQWTANCITILPNFTEEAFNELYEDEDMYDKDKDRPYLLTMDFGDFPAIWVKG